MALKKISAIIRSGQLETVERRLQQMGVPGISVTEMKGFGEQANFFRRDWFSPEVRLELFVCEEDVKAIICAIVDAARTGEAGDGIIVVQPVDEVVRIRTREPASAESLRCLKE